MSSSGGGEDGNNLKNTVSRSTTSSSSSISSFPSPSSTLPFLNPIRSNHDKKQTMKEVWKDISLSTLHHHHHSTTTTTSFQGVILQDFLARPISKDPPTSVSTGYGPHFPPPPASAQQQYPPTLLNLNSGPDQTHYLGGIINSDDDPAQFPVPNVGHLNHPFDHVLANSASSSRLLANSGMKMFPEAEKSSGDRRHKRMIKNRESAARSRARKQAYTNELENEVERLKEENARLERQQQQLCVAAAAQLPKKNTLRRSSTAPF